MRFPKDHPVQFRYLLDDCRWENDEAADAYWPNSMGTDNSVVFTARRPGSATLLNPCMNIGSVGSAGYPSR